MTAPLHQSTDRRDRILAWQHWQLAVPRTWDPIRFEGDFDNGEIRLADSRGPTLGLRWRTPRRRLTPERAVRDALLQEVGVLACNEARPGPAPGPDWTQALLHEEPDAQGRDVWTAFSTSSARLLQLVYFPRRRDNVLCDRLIPTLVDHPSDRATPWSVFDLSLIAPAEARLAGYRFNAGDLSLRFGGLNAFAVRQLAPATLALSRRPLVEWAALPLPTVGREPRSMARHYRLRTTGEGPILRPKNQPHPTLVALWTRRRRFFWQRHMSRTQIILTTHDAERDRLVFFRGSDEPLLCDIASTVGT